MDVEDYLSLGYVCSLRQVLQEAERLSSLYPADSPARQGAVPADQRSHCAAGRREALHTPGPHVHGPRQGGGEDGQRAANRPPQGGLVRGVRGLRRQGNVGKDFESTEKV